MKQFFTQFPRLTRSQAGYVLLGLGIGILFFGIVRFAFLPDQSTHYHANFGVFIHGERQAFTGAQYYQEIASCSAHDKPQSRVHMHDNVSDVVHVHDTLVTWSNFFSVLGWSVSDTSIFDGKRAYTDGQDGKLKFILNGKPVLSLANEVIKSEDRLLISFGAADQATLDQQYAQIPSSAGQFNQQPDPASCRGPQETDGWTRLRQALWW